MTLKQLKNLAEWVISHAVGREEIDELAYAVIEYAESKEDEGD